MVEKGGFWIVARTPYLTFVVQALVSVQCLGGGQLGNSKCIALSFILEERQDPNVTNA